jgi:hypothetical protein
MRLVDYVDEQGIPRRVWLPDEGGLPQEGIPASINLDELYAHAPHEFKVKLYQALWDVNLIQPKDFFAPGAPERIRAALLSVIREDLYSIQAKAKEQMNHA